MLDLGIEKIDEHGQEVHRIVIGNFEILVSFFKEEEWKLINMPHHYRCGGYRTTDKKTSYCAYKASDGPFYKYIGNCSQICPVYCPTCWKAHKKD